MLELTQVLLWTNAFRQFSPPHHKVYWKYMPIHYHCYIWTMWTCYKSRLLYSKVNYFNTKGCFLLNLIFFFLLVLTLKYSVHISTKEIWIQKRDWFKNVIWGRKDLFLCITGLIKFVLRLHCDMYVLVGCLNFYILGGHEWTLQLSCKLHNSARQKDGAM